jgi:voltage-gated sodium channel
MYAIVGHALLHEHDPAHWGDLGSSILSLFQVVTLDDWVAVMHTAAELKPLAWIYFVRFTIVATFVGVNLFVAIVVNHLGEINQERLRPLEQPLTADMLLSELRAIRSELRATQRSLQRLAEQL